MRVRLPRVRFTIRGLLIAVAVAGGLLAVGVGLKRLSDAYAEKAGRHTRDMYGSTLPAWYFYHRDLAAKYERAARQPWLPVSPDPPPPD